MSSFSPLTNPVTKIYVPSPPVVDNLNRKRYDGRASRYKYKGESSTQSDLHSNDIGSDYNYSNSNTNARDDKRRPHLPKPLRVSVNESKDNVDTTLCDDAEVLDALRNNFKAKQSFGSSISRLVTVSMPDSTAKAGNRLPGMGNAKKNLLDGELARIDGSGYDDGNALSQHQSLFRLLPSPNESLMSNKSSNSMYEQEDNFENNEDNSSGRRRVHLNKADEGNITEFSLNHMDISTDGTVLHNNDASVISDAGSVDEDSSFTEMPFESSFSCSDASPANSQNSPFRRHGSPDYWSGGGDLAGKSFFGQSSSPFGGSPREKFSKLFNHVPSADSVLNISSTSNEIDTSAEVNPSHDEMEADHRVEGVIEEERTGTMDNAGDIWH
jgi:hypothetical protein